VSTIKSQAIIGLYSILERVELMGGATMKPNLLIIQIFSIKLDYIYWKQGTHRGTRMKLALSPPIASNSVINKETKSLQLLNFQPAD
jgi:hypothetical protein